MNRLNVPAVWVLLVLLNAQLAFAQHASSDKKIGLTAEQKKLVETSKLLSATTMVDGPGWKQYGSDLHENFYRWSEGQEVWDRKRTIDVIKEWWDAGNRELAGKTAKSILTTHFVAMLTFGTLIRTIFFR